MKRFCRAIPIFLFSLSMVLSFFVMPTETEAKGSVSYTYRTVTLSFNSFDQWLTAVQFARNNALGFSAQKWYNSSGRVQINNGIIAGVTVLAYKTIKITGQNGQNVGSKVTHTLKLPSKIKFKIHRHSFKTSAMFTFSNLYCSMTCDCGYHDVYQWQVPWDAFDFSGAQNARRAQTKVYTVTVSSY